MAIEFKKDYTQEDIDNGNDVPMYCVSWDGKKRRIGNSWFSKDTATKVYNRKRAQGFNPTAREIRVAGCI
jgi:hypothetical protein